MQKRTIELKKLRSGKDLRCMHLFDTPTKAPKCRKQYPPTDLQELPIATSLCSRYQRNKRFFFSCRGNQAYPRSYCCVISTRTLNQRLNDPTKPKRRKRTMSNPKRLAAKAPQAVLCERKMYKGFFGVRAECFTAELGM